LFAEVLVSGIGNSYSDISNDAFYAVDDGGGSCAVAGAQIQITCSTLAPTYQLGVSSELSPLIYTGTSDAQNFITFIDSRGFVTPGTVPDYDPLNHTYHFVMDLSLFNTNSSSLLTFGVTDDYYTDNSGSFTIDIFQVQAVPIPPALWLFGTGLLGLVEMARRKTV
jgi:hypothetical protein